MRHNFKQIKARHRWSGKTKLWLLLKNTPCGGVQNSLCCWIKAGKWATQCCWSEDSQLASDDSYSPGECLQINTFQPASLSFMRRLLETRQQKNGFVRGSSLPVQNHGFGQHRTLKGVVDILTSTWSCVSSAVGSCRDISNKNNKIESIHPEEWHFSLVSVEKHSLRRCGEESGRQSRRLDWLCSHCLVLRIY